MQKERSKELGPGKRDLYRNLAAQQAPFFVGLNEVWNFRVPIQGAGVVTGFLSLYK